MLMEALSTGADVGGLDVPDIGPVFFAALGLHVAAGVTCLVSGALAATAHKQAGRHPRAGAVYLYGIGVVFVTASVMAIIRWEQDAHLFAIAAGTFSVAMLGWWVRRKRPRRWLALHGAAMAGSYIALLTGFYVDNGPQLPLWNQLPDLAFWLLPAAIGIPLTLRALIHNGAISRRRPSAARIADQRRPRR